MASSIGIGSNNRTSVPFGPAASSTFGGSQKVLEWICRFDSMIFRFEKIAASGSYSILNKEIQEITPFLREGKRLVSSHSPEVDSINRLAGPRLLKLEQVVANAQKKIASDPEIKVTDDKLTKKWETLGFPAPILEYHADCARFLIESKLAFSIAGYKQTRVHHSEDDVRLDSDGHPLIKMQGRFVRWEKIARELEYDPVSDKIRSRGNSAQTWNYFYPDGLVPLDRFNYNRAYPIYQLSQDEYDRVIASSKKFYETNPELDVGVPKDCVLQFFTSPRLQGFPDHPLLANFHRNIPVHIGIRLITADRQVYSFGWQLPNEESVKVFTHPLSTLAKTAVVKVSMMDYEEFRNHEGRVVTSVPLSSLRSGKILDHVNELSCRHLRLQYARQNCTVVAGELLDIAGYHVGMRTTVGETFLGMVPNLNQLPVIGSTIAKIENAASRTWGLLPNFISHPLSLAKKIILWLPNKVEIFLTNLLILKMGGAKMTAPLPNGVVDEELTDRPGLQTFSRVIRSWTDMFKEETSAVSHSKYFFDWQKKQKSTFVEPGSSPPKLTIVPPAV